MELLLPVLPENENLDEMTWESTTQDFETFQMLLTGWGIIELRLNAITQYKDKTFADQLVKEAQQNAENIRRNILSFLVWIWIIYLCMMCMA